MLIVCVDDYSGVDDYSVIKFVFCHHLSSFLYFLRSCTPNLMFMHVTTSLRSYIISFSMPLKFENTIIDLLLCPPAQDEFKSWRLELLLIQYMNKYYIDQIEDVIQILYKIINELERVKTLRLKCKLGLTLSIM